MATIALYNMPDQYKNDTFNGVQFTIQNSAGDAIDLTGATVATKFRKNSKTGTVVKSITSGSGITVSDPSNGILSYDAFILDWDYGTYYYDLEVTFASGVVKTYVYGTINVIQDVTYA